LKQALFFEAAGVAVEVDLSLKSNQLWQVYLVTRSVVEITNAIQISC